MFILNSNGVTLKNNFNKFNEHISNSYRFLHVCWSEDIVSCYVITLLDCNYLLQIDLHLILPVFHTFLLPFISWFINVFRSIFFFFSFKTYFRIRFLFISESMYRLFYYIFKLMIILSRTSFHYFHLVDTHALLVSVHFIKKLFV